MIQAFDCLAYIGMLNSPTMTNSRDVNELAQMATMCLLGFLLCSYCCPKFLNRPLVDCCICNSSDVYEILIGYCYIFSSRCCAAEAYTCLCSRLVGLMSINR